MPVINTMIDKVMRFLTQKMDVHHRDVAEKAAGMFCREAKLTPRWLSTWECAYRRSTRTCASSTALGALST